MRRRGRSCAFLGPIATAFLVAGGCSSEDATVRAPWFDVPAASGNPEALGSGTSPKCLGRAPAAALTVETYEATAIGIDAFSANGCIEPRGEPTTYWFEYGRTTDYGSKTAEQALSPRLAAYYRESWNDGLAGWSGGMNGADLAFVVAGGTKGGFARFTMPSLHDSNHFDGIGFLQLPEYLHIGTYVQPGIASAALGGGDPDMRDARVSLDVRGNKFDPRGTELFFWAQADLDLATQNDADWRRANWAHTGFSLTGAALPGDWQHVEYRLENDSRAWSYSGTNVGGLRPNYAYWPIHEVLGHLNCNIIHVLAFVTLASEPQGSLDFDELEIAYRNHSLLIPSNGGKMVSSPAGATDASRLTDGWRFGEGKTWQTAANPTTPQELVYELALPVTIDAVQIHQDPENPSRDVEVLVSEDGTTWALIVVGVVPDRTPLGPNFTHLLARNLGAKARFVKVRVLSGYRADRWGLGEIEVFGRGAEKRTDDAWYQVTLDVTKLEPGTPYHYRLVAKTKDRTVMGEDRTFVTPPDRRPLTDALDPTRVGGGRATLWARLDALGTYTEYTFQYGLDSRYGLVTPTEYGGQAITPRAVAATLQNLTPGVTYHYRIVAWNAAGTTASVDRSFVAK